MKKYVFIMILCIGSSLAAMNGGEEGWDHGCRRRRSQSVGFEGVAEDYYEGARLLDRRTVTLCGVLCLGGFYMRLADAIAQPVGTSQFGIANPCHFNPEDHELRYVVVPDSEGFKTEVHMIDRVHGIDLGDVPGLMCGQQSLHDSLRVVHEYWRLKSDGRRYKEKKD